MLGFRSAAAAAACSPTRASCVSTRASCATSRCAAPAMFILRGEAGVTLADSRGACRRTSSFSGGARSGAQLRLYQSLGVKEGNATVGGRYLATASASTCAGSGRSGAPPSSSMRGYADTRADYDLRVGYGVGARWHNPAGPLSRSISPGATRAQPANCISASRWRSEPGAQSSPKGLPRRCSAASLRGPSTRALTACRRLPSAAGWPAGRPMSNSTSPPSASAHRPPRSAGLHRRLDHLVTRGIGWQTLRAGSAPLTRRPGAAPRRLEEALDLLVDAAHRLHDTELVYQAGLPRTTDFTATPGRRQQGHQLGERRCRPRLRRGTARRPRPASDDGNQPKRAAEGGHGGSARPLGGIGPPELTSRSMSMISPAPAYRGGDALRVGENCRRRHHRQAIDLADVATGGVDQPLPPRGTWSVAQTGCARGGSGGPVIAAIISRSRSMRRAGGGAMSRRFAQAVVERLGACSGARRRRRGTRRVLDQPRQPQRHAKAAGQRGDIVASRRAANGSRRSPDARSRLSMSALMRNGANFPGILLAEQVSRSRRSPISTASSTA